MRWVGHQLEADAELDIDPSLNFDDAHEVAHGAEHELVHAIPKLGLGRRARVPGSRGGAQQLNLMPMSAGGVTFCRHPNGSMPASLNRAADRFA
jgi:hypothetical protein